MMTIDHDIQFGHITRCQICGSGNLEVVIDLGYQPLCCSLLSKDQLNKPEPTYPLRLFRCIDCCLAQIDFAVESEVVYFPDYPYRAGITQELVEYQHDISNELVGQRRLAPGAFVVDIGSNDGTLLSGFKGLGMRVLGVEPTNIARIANQDGIETIQSFFTEKLAREIVKDYGHADVVTATNVLAHMASLGEVMRGIQVLLRQDGVLMVENHYLLDVIRGVQFDTVYHEHLRSYTLKSLITLFEMYDLTVIEARRVSRYGGNIRVFVAKGRNRPVGDSVKQLLDAEAQFGLYSSSVYRTFRERTKTAKNDLLTLALKAARRGERFVGKACPGRCSTLINYYGIDKELMPYIAEQSSSLKLGMYLPGKHIPVVDDKVLFEEQPDYVVLLAWHYWEPISQQLWARGLRSKFVVPLPEVRILENY